jgi:hypothetical protein
MYKFRIANWGVNLVPIYSDIHFMTKNKTTMQINDAPIIKRYIIFTVEAYIKIAAYVYGSIATAQFINYSSNRKACYMR